MLRLSFNMTVIEQSRYKLVLQSKKDSLSGEYFYLTFFVIIVPVSLYFGVIHGFVVKYFFNSKAIFIVTAFYCLWLLFIILMARKLLSTCTLIFDKTYGRLIWNEKFLFSSRTRKHELKKITAIEDKEMIWYDTSPNDEENLERYYAESLILSSGEKYQFLYTKNHEKVLEMRHNIKYFAPNIVVKHLKEYYKNNSD